MKYTREKGMRSRREPERGGHERGRERGPTGGEDGRVGEFGSVGVVLNLTQVSGSRGLEPRAIFELRELH